MGQDELTCLTVVLVLFLVLVVVAIFAANRHQARVRNSSDATIQLLLNSVRGLTTTPDHRTTLEHIVSATDGNSWVPHVANEQSRDLWNEALGFAFDNIRLPSGETILYRILVPLSSSPVRDIRQVMSAMRQVIADNPADRRIHQIILNCLRAMTVEPIQQRWLYDRVLDLVQQSPSSVDLSVLALEVGRCYLGKSRPDGRATVYDESAIQNDIAVRRGMA
jgi:hypothetical protein